MIINYLKKINAIRRENKEKIWLVHVLVMASVFIAYWILSDIEFVYITRILNFIYSGFCILSLLILMKASEKFHKFIFAFYAIPIHSIILFSIELEERGITGFIAVILFNFVISLFLMNKKPGPSHTTKA